MNRGTAIAAIKPNKEHPARSSVNVNPVFDVNRFNISFDPDCSSWLSARKERTNAGRDQVRDNIEDKGLKWQLEGRTGDSFPVRPCT
jgi:hypothetical protein